jgi:hypothetical protein
MHGDTGFLLLAHVAHMYHNANSQFIIFYNMNFYVVTQTKKSTSLQYGFVAIYVTSVHLPWKNTERQNLL